MTKRRRTLRIALLVAVLLACFVTCLLSAYFGPELPVSEPAPDVLDGAPPTLMPFYTWTPGPTATVTATLTPSSTPTPRPTATATPPRTPVSSSPLSTPTTMPLLASTPSAGLNALEERMFEAVNAQRDRRDIAPLRADETLASLARAHAEDMVGRGYRGHVTPDGVTYRDRLGAAGLDPDAAGENWVYVSRSSSQAVRYAINWFMNSVPHRRNILQKRYTRLGVGVARTRDGGHIYVLTFAGKELD